MIVPVYNKENLIRQCLDSFVSDDFEGLLEVIVIDDGSTDSSYDIMMEYVEKNPDIFLAVKKENGGVGSVINLGLKMAKGKYIKEVDADDWIDTKALDNLIRFLRESSADIILNPFLDIDSENNRLKEHFFKGFYYGRVYQIEEVINKALFCIQNITVRKQILDMHQFSLKEDRYYIDMQFVDSSILFAETCVFLSDSLYRYRKLQEEQSVSISSYIKNRESFYSQVMLSFDRLQQIRRHPELRNRNENLIHKAETYSLYLYAIFLISKELSEDWRTFDNFLFKEHKGIYILLNKYTCVKYLRNWKFMPHGVMRWFYLKRWEKFCTDNQKIPEISDVRYI